MKVVLPVEYCPSSSTDGLASKSLSLMRGLKKCPNLYISSSGRTWATPVHSCYLTLDVPTFMSGILFVSRMSKAVCCLPATWLRAVQRLLAKFWAEWMSSVAKCWAVWCLLATIWLLSSSAASFWAAGRVLA